MTHPDGLLERIRQKILRGQLPKEDCRITWYGLGTGQICVACDQRITPEQIEVECILPDGRSVRLHRTCYDIWKKEWPTNS